MQNLGGQKQVSYLLEDCKLREEFDWDFNYLPLRSTTLRWFKGK